MFFINGGGLIGVAVGEGEGVSVAVGDGETVSVVVAVNVGEEDGDVVGGGAE